MRKKGFEWVRDAEEPVTPSPDRPSRREKRRPAIDADDIVDAILAMNSAQAAAIPLSDLARQELVAYHAVKSGAHGARRRQMLHLSAVIRGEDIEAIQAAMEGKGKSTARDADLEGIVRWRTRIIENGDSALQAFLDEHPSADRQRMRQLAGKVRKTGDARASKQLMAMLREAAGL